MAAYLTDHGNGERPQIIFDALPIHEAKSFLVLIIVYSLCLGMVVLETVRNLKFDYRLVRKSGWTSAPKLLSRIGYLLCRYLSLACLTLVIVFLTNQFDNCRTVPLTFNILGMLLLDSVSLIFVQRTMALYAWKPKVVIPLSIFYLVVVALAAVCVPFYGVGYRIPASDYCAYDTRRNLTRVLVANVVYKSTSMLLDFTLLLLTLHRLVDGGLKSFFTSKARRVYYDLNKSSLSSFLVRQGFHFYVVQTCTEIVFVSIYFTTNEVSYQVLGSALLFSIPPIAAGAAFREMGKKASTIAPRNSGKVNEIMNSTNTPSGDASGAAAYSRDRRRSSVQISAAPGARSTHGDNRSGRPYGLGIASQEPMPQEKGRVGFSHHPSQSSRNHGPHDGDNGVMVTMSTISRTEEIEEGWDDIGSPRYSSDNADPDPLQRYGSKMGRVQRDDGLERSSSTRSYGLPSAGHSAYGGVDSKDSFAHDMSIPTLDHARPSYSTGPNSPWIPQTPESPYPVSPSAPYTTHHNTLFERVTFPSSALTSAGRERALSPPPQRRPPTGDLPSPPLDEEQQVWRAQ